MSIRIDFLSYEGERNNERHPHARFVLPPDLAHRHARHAAAFLVRNQILVGNNSDYSSDHNAPFLIVPMDALIII